ncbi:tetratricopeptide repeat protein [Mastigocoleus sp. MO_188.B34]|uniref:tetratricopeptide repeat protein n=1 Tax=Mastigocoleus sp. MO_188.B34 TaxID=3036635 RepID=UPI0026307964|nr:tetratricopeptide repeat protein [Mastigocoleus sp. MO_188.B34]MDJ0693986.1 tetratricopeptide repeat protein [Mastigocoleus sp. MO_188.B34]
MDWTTVLRSLQSDFIKRLKSGCLLHCQKEGEYSELTIISGERLRLLRDFCWEMAEKYKRAGTVRDVFISNLKGKLGEEVVKERLADLITEIDYAKRFGGDGNVDFTLLSDPTIGIEVKSRSGTFDKVRWSLSVEEVRKNAVVVCVLIQEQVNEAQSKFNLILAGFLPTKMIKLKTGKISFGIDQLFHGSGLRCYLEEIQSARIETVSEIRSQELRSQGFNNQEIKNQEIKNQELRNQEIRNQELEHQEFKYRELKNQELRNQAINHRIYGDRIGQRKLVSSHSGSLSIESRLKSGTELYSFYVKLGDRFLEKTDYNRAMENYTQALQIKPNETEIYYKRGFAKYQLGDYQGAIEDCTWVVTNHPNYVKAYNYLGDARYQLGDYEGAIADYSEVIRLNPFDANAYRNRADARYNLGDKQGAIEDYVCAIDINPVRNAQGDRNARGDRNYSYENLTQVPNHLENHLEISQAKEIIKGINPEDVPAYKNRGNNRYDLGDYRGAILDYTRIIDIDPDPKIYVKRGDAYYDFGDKEAAIADYTEAIKINPENAEIYNKRGDIFYELEDKEAAITDFQKATEIYQQQGKLTEHKQAREKILDLEIEESLDILNF